jgi:hypothetical protein
MTDSATRSNGAPPTETEDAPAWDTGEGPTSEQVGYRRPPRRTRFQPGQSGNPRGRPKGVKSLSDIVRKIVGQKVSVTENGRTWRIPRLEAILLRAAGEASRGDAGALRLLLQLAERYGESAQSGSERETIAAEDAAIMRRYFRVLGEAALVEAEAQSVEMDRNTGAHGEAAAETGVDAGAVDGR